MGNADPSGMFSTNAPASSSQLCPAWDCILFTLLIGDLNAAGTRDMVRASAKPKPMSVSERVGKDIPRTTSHLTRAEVSTFKCGAEHRYSGARTELLSGENLALILIREREMTVSVLLPMFLLIGGLGTPGARGL